MQRPILHDPLRIQTLHQVMDWHQQINAHAEKGDSLWVVVDGALLGAAGAVQLQSAYGPPIRAFDATPLAAYEELGLLLWPWVKVGSESGMALLRTTMAERPGISFVRVRDGHTDALCRVLAWLAGAVTADGVPLYMRVGDTRVLNSFLRHMRPTQQAQLQTAVREWIWPDRAGHARSMVIATAMPPTPLDLPLVLDDLQYTAVLDDAAADILHATLRPIESVWRDERTGSQMHMWLSSVIDRANALGIFQQQDQMAFVSLALRVSGKFELAPELGETWLRVRSGMTSLPDEVENWTPHQWSAVEKYWQPV